MLTLRLSTPHEPTANDGDTLDAWGPGHAQWCVDFESPGGTVTGLQPGETLACRDWVGVSAIPLQRDQAPTPEEAVSRTFSDPEYGLGPDFSVELSPEDGETWIVRDPSGNIVGTAVAVQVADGTWGTSEWKYCP